MGSDSIRTSFWLGSLWLLSALLLDPLLPSAHHRPSPLAATIHVVPASDLADGVEMADSLWLSDGLPEFNGNLGMGYLEPSKTLDPAWMFHLSGFAHGDSVAFARLRFTTLGGNLSDTLRLAIQGLYHCTWEPFRQDYRPSQMSATQAVVHWPLLQPWPYGASWDPLYAVGPDITPIVNEILSSSSWPAPTGSSYLSLTIQTQTPCPGCTWLCKFADSGTVWPPVELEIYRSVEDAFKTPPLLGQITDRSVVVDFAHFLSLDYYVAYGTAPGEYRWAQGRTQTTLPLVDPILATTRGEAQRVALCNLDPDTRYCGRLFFRRANATAYQSAPEFSFHTQRASGETFQFDVTTDAHIENKLDTHLDRDLDVYKVALQNVAADVPDFVIDLGDLAINIEAAIGVRSLEEAERIYRDAREYLGILNASVPYYLVLGNHEGELGWLNSGRSDGIFAWSTQARTEYIPNPHPDGFYTGNPQEDPQVGLLGNYYAWEWGDALFVVLDPFRYTQVKPHHYGGGGTMDGWDWTLGREQYDWLAHVLSTSQKRWKMVFIHHLAGGVVEPTWGPYGRGGIEAVRYSEAHRPSFEWGGEDSTGDHVFSERRPGWQHGDIHSLLLNNGVAAVFHGHDHGFYFQQIDGIVYQECPTPSDARYEYGLLDLGGYRLGARLPNSGHLRLTVSPEEVLVEYVRAYLPGDGENGHVEYAYRMTGTGTSVETGSPESSTRLRLRPIPSDGRLWIDLLRPWSGEEVMTLHDPTGRVCARLSLPTGYRGPAIPWDLNDPEGRPLASGVYLLRAGRGPDAEVHRVLIVR